MRDLLLLESLVGILLLLSVLRPLFKSFEGIQGLFLLSPLALLITVGLFWVYGFRPECIPLLLASLVMTLLYVPKVIFILLRLRTDDYGEVSLAGPLVGTVVVLFSLFVAVLYVPRVDNPGRIAESTVLEVRDPSLKLSLILHLFIPPDTGSGTEPLFPVAVVVPPVTGSVSAVDSLCGALKARGFFVVSFSAPGFDIPAVTASGARMYPALANLGKAALFNLWGNKIPLSAEYGKQIEEERARAIQQVFSLLTGPAENRDPLFKTADPENCILVGYGSGGMGAALRAPRGSPIRGIVAVDGSLTELGTLPSPQFPVLFLLSDRSKNPVYRDSRYAPVLRVFRNGQVPTSLVTISGAGYFDYSDVSNEYPLFSVLFPGEGKRVLRSEWYVQQASQLIANFASLFISDNNRITRNRVTEQASLETFGPWNTIKAEGILGQ